MELGWDETWERRGWDTGRLSSSPAPHRWRGPKDLLSPELGFKSRFYYGMFQPKYQIKLSMCLLWRQRCPTCWLMPEVPTKARVGHGQQSAPRKTIQLSQGDARHPPPGSWHRDLYLAKTLPARFNATRLIPQ